MSDHVVRPAGPSDLPGILRVQRDAFGRVAAGLGIAPEHLPPLTETLEDLHALHVAGVRFFVATTPDGTVIGSVRAAESERGVEVGRLVVDGGHLRQGIATALMEALEASLPDARRFELFTGAEARVPLALYTGLGYRRVRSEKVGAVELVWLEKVRPSG